VRHRGRAVFKEFTEPQLAKLADEASFHAKTYRTVA